MRERRDVSADTARRLARYFGTTSEFWLNLQMQFDLGRAPGREIARIEALAAKGWPAAAAKRPNKPCPHG